MNAYSYNMFFSEYGVCSFTLRSALMISSPLVTQARKANALALARGESVLFKISD